MVQLAMKMNQFEDIDFYLLAIDPKFKHRGKHWLDTLGYSNNIFYYNSEVDICAWIKAHIENIEPNIVFSAYNRGLIFELLAKNKKKYGYQLGKWNEPYVRAGIWKILAPFRNLITKYKWRRSLDFILLIDDRAVTLYRNFVKKPEMAFRFPYIEDVPEDKGIKKSGTDEIVRFLFSGRLVKTHNIKLLAKAFDLLEQNYPNQFELLISAEGSEKLWFDKLSSKYHPQSIIFYDTEFEKWDDRLRPFYNSHVLVLPSSGSGWGLVINEALALGLPVISTNQVGAARTLVEHMVNGIIIEPTVKEIYSALEYFLVNKGEIERMSANALALRNTYNLEIGTQKLRGIFMNIISDNYKRLYS